MDDADLVRRLERLGNLARERQRLVDRNRTFRDALGEVFALDELHDDRARACGFLDAVDLRDVRMVEGGEDLGLALEAGQAVAAARLGCAGVSRQMRRQDLDGDVAIQLGVAGAIDLAHRAGAEGADDFVDAKARAGLERHWGGSIAGLGKVRALDDGWRPTCVRSAQADIKRRSFCANPANPTLTRLRQPGTMAVPLQHVSGRSPRSPRFTFDVPWYARVGEVCLRRDVSL